MFLRCGFEPSGQGVNAKGTKGRKKNVGGRVDWTCRRAGREGRMKGKGENAVAGATVADFPVKTNLQENGFVYSEINNNYLA